MQNNRDNLINKKNKLNDTNNKGKYEINSKKSTDTPSSSSSSSSALNNVVVCQNGGPKSNNTNNVSISNNQLKNDTYESVCSPEDVAERTKMAQRHSIAVIGNGHGSGTGNSAISAITAHNSNSSMPLNVTNCNTIGSSNNHSVNVVNSTLNNTNSNNSNSNNSNNNNNRVLKRVISAPVATNETKGNYLPLTRSLSISIAAYTALSICLLHLYTHTFPVENRKISTACNRLAIECLFKLWGLFEHICRLNTCVHISAETNKFL